jgi:hypothetical protein
MRLSDAIMMGSTMIKARALKMLNEDRTEGCAIGMAAVACPTGRFAWASASMPSPCGCGCAGLLDVWMVIAHLFDVHVTGAVGGDNVQRWTFEQLVDWVRSTEPPEDPQGSEWSARQQSNEVVPTQNPA